MRTPRPLFLLLACSILPALLRPQQPRLLGRDSRGRVCFSLVLLFVLIGVCCSPVTVQAQATNVSDMEATPIPDAGHNYTGMLEETVDPANGSLSVRINVPMPPGRKLTVPFAFAYDSNSATTTTIPVGRNPYLFQGGWKYTAPVLNFQNTLASVTLDDGRKETCSFTSGYVFTDPEGTLHSFPTVIVAGNNTTCPEYFGITTNTTGGDAWLSYGGGIHDADGTSYCGLISGDPGTCTIEDRNGNVVQYIDSGNGVFTIKDTAGRTVLSSNGFGATGNTITVSEFSSPYDLTWGTAITPSANWGTPVVAYNSSPGYGCNSGGPSQITSAITLLSVLTLPNGQSYKFYYDPTWGLLDEIVYPTGGWVKYTWGLNAQSEMEVGTATTSDGPHPCFIRIGNPAVLARQVSYNGTTVAQEQDYTYYPTTWSEPAGTSGAEWWTAKETTVVTRDDVRAQSFQTVYMYSPVLIAAPAGLSDYVGTQVPVESSVAYYDVTGSPLKTVSKTWFNQYLMQSEETAWANGQTSEVTYTYGSLGVVTDKAEYDYGLLLIRNTVTNYQSFPANTIGSTIYDRPCQTIVYDGNSNRYAETDYYYDNGVVGTPCGTAGTPSITGVGDLTGHDETNFGTTSSPPRGNATTMVELCFTSGQCGSGNPTTTYTYDETGQALSMTDPRHNTTNYSYADSYTTGTPPGSTNAFLTQVTYPPTNGVAHIENFSYGWPDGQLTLSKDQNGQPTTYTYNDPLDRLTQTSYPDGGVTTLAYNDTPPMPTVTTSKKLNSSQTVVSVAVEDGLGHVTETELTSDPQGTVYTVRAYDGPGRVYTATTPYRTTGDSTYGTTIYGYDALNRATSVVDADGSNSTVTTKYCGSSTLVTDEAGRWRRSTTDGLGRLVEVDEPNSTTATVTACPAGGDPIWATTYGYDPLDDLTSVVQGGSRNRSFGFDSVKRLASSTNPETGTVTYGYDANSNVVTKTDARNITTTYAYDALNRPTGMTYSNSDPSVAYNYDQATCVGQSPCYNIGHRTTMTDAGGTGTLSYDQMGREWGEQRTTNNVTKTTTYTYDLAGDLATLTYPSGRTITYTYDSAARPSDAQDVANSINYATGSCANGAANPSSGACYAPQGAVSQLQNGTNLVSTYIYNDRLQPCWMYATTGTALLTNTACTAADPGPGNILDLKYGFNFGSGDNGDVTSIANNRDTTRSQSFTYDQVNRILSGQTSTTTGSNCWGEGYSYDQWANLQSVGYVSGYTGCAQEGTWSVTATADNQLPSSAATYDAAGNTLNDNFNIYQWNAESEIKSAAGVNYTYDGDGDRLEKSSGKIYWYGAGTEILDESDLSGNFTNEYVFFGGKRIAMRNVSSGTIDYYAEDMLGSSRTIVQAGQTSVCYDADFYPFGGERDVTVSCMPNYKFEGKERDSETENDDFGARYYSWRVGRWLSADWSAVPVPVPYANLTNPQTLNLYAMVHDNPETFADLDGHRNLGALIACGPDGVACSGIDSAPITESETEAAAAAAAAAAAQATQTAQTAAGQQQEKSPTSMLGRIFGKIGSWFGAAATPFIRWGKLGGPAHRAKIDEVAKRLQEEGYTVDREVQIKTPNGIKSSRWVDLQGTKPNGEVVYYQIGKQNANGIPVPREVQAAGDIEGQTGIPVNFVPYNVPQPTASVPEQGLPRVLPRLPGTDTDIDIDLP